MDGERREFFEKEASGWENRGGPPPERLARVVREALIGPGQAVLDVGSGTGALIPFILEAGPPARLVALDYAAAMIAELRKKRFPPVVEIVHGDIHRTTFADGTFDRVVANAVLPHLDDRAAALREIRRVLKPDGLLAISHPRGRRWVNEHHRRFSAVAEDILPPAAGLGRLLECAGFSVPSAEDEEEFYLVTARPASDASGAALR